MTARGVHMLRMPELIRRYREVLGSAKPGDWETDRLVSLLEADLRWRLENDHPLCVVDGGDGCAYLINDDGDLVSYVLVKASEVDRSYPEAVARFDAESDASRPISPAEQFPPSADEDLDGATQRILETAARELTDSDIDEAARFAAASDARPERRPHVEPCQHVRGV